MTSADFWPLIALLEGEPSEEGLARLEDELVARGGDAAERFADDLALAVHAIDTPAHMRQPVKDVSEPDEGLALQMSPDVFLYTRLAVVAAGEQAWRRVLADPGALAGRWAVADGEALLYVAERAYERATGLAWEHEPVVGMEAGDNREAWNGERLTSPVPPDMERLKAQFEQLRAQLLANGMSAAQLDAMIEQTEGRRDLTD